MMQQTVLSSEEETGINLLIFSIHPHNIISNFSSSTKCSSCPIYSPPRGIVDLLIDGNFLPFCPISDLLQQKSLVHLLTRQC